MQMIRFNGRQVACQVQGQGFPLVLVHGFGEDQTVWDKLAERVSDFQIVRMDLPGVGDSELGEEDTVEYFAQSVKAVLDVLEIPRCVLVGHSMGGYVALAFAELFPQYLAGWGLFHSHPFADNEEAKAAREKSIRFVETNGPIHYVKQLIPKLFPAGFVSSNNFIINQQIFKASKFSGEGIIACQRAMQARPDRSHVLKGSKVPVLTLIGEKDELIPFDKNLEQTFMADRTVIHILEGIGHMGMLEAPGQTAIILSDFSHHCLAH